MAHLSDDLLQREALVVRWIGAAGAAGKFGAALVIALLIYYLAVKGYAFSFLFTTAGWDIAYSILPYARSDPYWWAFLVGLVNTITAGLICAVAATLLGFITSLARLSPNKLIADLAKLYVDIIRNVPLLLQASFWYAIALHLPPARGAYSIAEVAFLSNRGLFVPAPDKPLLFFSVLLLPLIGLVAIMALRHRREECRREGAASQAARWGMLILAVIVLMLMMIAASWQYLSINFPVRAGLNFRGGFNLSPELVAVVAAITVYRGAFLAEIFRGGLVSVQKGQIDAAKALALSSWTTLVRIRVPLALVSIMPPLASEYMVIMKITSIGIVVGYMDLFSVSSMTFTMTGQVIQVLIIMGLVYIALNYFIASMLNAFNQRLQSRGFS